MITLRATRGCSGGSEADSKIPAAALAANSLSTERRTPRRGEVGGNVPKCGVGIARAGREIAA